MNRLRATLLAAFLLLGCALGHAQVGSLNGNCQKGNIFPLAFGTPTTNPMMGSFPQCTITVYLTGTLTLAPNLYQNLALTPLTNSFTGNLDGSWLFYAQTGIGYDVVMSGGIPFVMPAPITLTDIFTGGSGSGGSGISNFFGNVPGAVLSQLVDPTKIIDAAGSYISFTTTSISWSDLVGDGCSGATGTLKCQDGSGDYLSLSDGVFKVQVNGSGPTFEITSSQYFLNDGTSNTISSTGGHLTFADSVTLVGCSSGTYVKADGTGCGVPSGGGTITGATANGGLVVTGSTLGLILTCSTNQVLAWSGSAWICASPGTGTITGSGTIGYLPEFTGSTTAIGNSPIRDNSGVIQSAEQIQVINNGGTLPVNQQALLAGSTFTLSGACALSGGAGSNNFLYQPSCDGAIISIIPNTGAAGVVAGLFAEAFPQVTSSTPAVAAVYGWGTTNGNGSPNYITGVAGVGNATPGNTGTIANLTGIEGLAFLQGAQTATIMAGVAGQVQNQSSGNTQPFAAALYARSPAFITGAIISNVVGLYIADQTVGGGTANPGPQGIVEAGTAPNVLGGSLTLLNLAGGGVQCATISNTGLVAGAGTTCVLAPSGNQGEEIANSSSGSGTSYSVIPNVFHVSKFASLAAANAVGTGLTPTTYMLISDPSSTALTVSSTITLGSGTTQGATFENRGVPINCTGSSGDCIDLANWARYICRGSGGSPSNGCRFTQGTGSTLNALIGNSVINGAQSNFMLDGVQAQSNGLATNAVTCGVLCVIAVEGKGYIRDSSFGAQVGQIGMNFQDAASGSGDNNALVIENVQSFCSNLIHCLPLNIWGATGTGTGNGLGYTFVGSSFVDVGNSNPNSLSASALCADGHDCLANIDGTSNGVSNTNYVGGVSFLGTYFETAVGMDASGSMIESKNNAGLAVISGVFNGGAAIQNCVEVSQAAVGKTSFVFVLARILNAKCVNAINNTVTSYTMASSGSTDVAYLYPGYNPGGGGFVVDGNQIINGTLALKALTNSANPLCQPSGVITNVGCASSGSGTVASGTIDGLAYYTAATTVGSITPPTVNGSYLCGYVVASSVAVVPTCSLPGVPVDATNPATLLYTDRATYIKWSSGTALALPAVATNFASNMPFVIQNLAGSTLTITPNAGASDLIDSAASGTVLANFAAWVYQDSTSAPGHWWTIKVPTFAALGSTCANAVTWSTTTGFGCSPVLGTVTSIATTSPITGGTITTSGTIACATCVTSAASLTSTALMTGAGGQASQTPDATATLSVGGVLAGVSLAESLLTGAAAAATITEGGATFSITRAGIATANLTAPWVFSNLNSTNNNTSITLGITGPGTSTGQVILNVNGASTGGDLVVFGTGGTWTAGVLSGQTKQAGINTLGIFETYAGQSTSGLGVATEIGTASDVTGQSTSQSTVNLIASTAQAGNYKVRYYLDQNATCATPGPGQVLLTFNWTDATHAHSATTVPLSFVSALTTAGGYLQGDVYLFSATASAISYTSTVTACTTGTATYDVHVQLEETK